MPETPTLHWLDGQTVVNLRGRPDDDAFVQAAAATLGLALPLEACRTVQGPGLRIVWAGPDDWFVIAPPGQADDLCRRLQHALAGVHAAVTDVSGGYTVLRVAGPGAADTLAQGCPLDLHPRAFGDTQAAGTHFFKASVWLWRGHGDNSLELLVRSSFRGYVALMLERATRKAR